MLSRVRVRTKLMGLLAGICLLALSAACAAFVWFDRKSYSQAKRATLTVLTDAVAQSASGAVAFADGDSAAYVLQTVEREGTAVAAAIYLPDGTQLTNWHRAGTEKPLPEQASGLPAALGIVDGELRVRRPVKQGDQQLGELFAVFSTSDIEARTRQFLMIAGMVLLFAFLAAWGLASMAHVVLTRPVNMLVEAVSAVEQKQDFSVRAQKVSEDELGLLTDSFNAMLGAIQARDGELAVYRGELEQRVEARTRDLDARNAAMRLVLDNVDQGFVTIDRDGVLQSERSEAFDRFFGAPAAGARLCDHLDTHGGDLGLAFEMGWEAVTDGFLPLELALEQLPQRIRTDNGRHFDVGYRPILEGEELDKTLVIFTDVTAVIARERGQAQQAETIAIFEGIAHDSAGFMDFFREAERIMRRILDQEDLPIADVLRDLHTLKGNFGISRMHSMASEIHAIEDRCLQSGDRPCPEDAALLRDHWNDFASRVRTFVSDAGSDLRVARAELEALREALDADGASPAVMTMVERLEHEPTAARLERLGAEARRIAKRLDLGELRLDIEANGVRIPGGSAWLWGVLPHLVRNGVDHGLTSARAAGRAPTMRLSTRLQHDALLIEVADNGGGIDWEAVRNLADERGLPSKTEAQLFDVLFADNVSTRSEVTELSGRGVGLAAVRAAVEAHGGRVSLGETGPSGTRFVISVPLDQLCDEPSTVQALSA